MSAQDDIAPQTIIFVGNLTVGERSTSSLFLTQTRSFWTLGEWNSSKGDSSEKITRLHSVMPHNFRSWHHRILLVTWAGVNLGVHLSLKGLASNEDRNYMWKNVWEIGCPAAVKRLAKDLVECLRFSNDLLMTILAMQKMLFFQPWPSRFSSISPASWWFFQFRTVLTATPRVFATCACVAPASYMPMAWLRVETPCSFNISRHRLFARKKLFVQLSCMTGASMSAGITSRLSEAEPTLYVPWRENLKFKLIKYAEVKNFNITTGNQFLYTLYMYTLEHATRVILLERPSGF